MEIKAHVSHDFNVMNPQTKVAFGPNVIAQLTANAATFPNLPFPVGDLTLANSDLDSKYQAFLQYGTNAKGAFVESEKEWLRKFRKTADYVDVVADGQQSIINQSGFHVTQTETNPAEKPEVPENADMVGGRSKGTVQAHVDAIKGAKGYIFGVATEDIEVDQTGNQLTFKLGDSFVSLIISTQRKVEFVNLPSHVDVQAAAAAFNSAGLGEFTSGLEVSIP